MKLKTIVNFTILSTLSLTLAKASSSSQSIVSPIFHIAQNNDTTEIEEEIIYISDDTELIKVDKRKRKSKSSPDYLDSVGRIEISFKDKRLGKCSGTLIATTPGQSSRVIQTAAHCFGNTKTETKYDIEKIIWSVTTKSGLDISKELTIESIDFKNDLATTSFINKIPFSTIKPALVETEYVFSPAELLTAYGQNGITVSAGYSADEHKGDKGKTLTYEEISYRRIWSTIGQDYNNVYKLNTVVYSGASGGAVLFYADLSYEEIENPYTQMFYMGTIISLDGSDKLYRKESSVTTGGNIVNFQGYGRVDEELVNRLNN